jgi:CheY-like chemotaxis protein
VHSDYGVQQKTRILIVDDDATIRLLMKDALIGGAYDIAEFTNGIDALEHLEQHSADLILLDVNMPGMSGFEVCTKIRKLSGGSDISIVMVTALEDAESIAKSYDLGATDFISKPINWDTFPFRIQYLIKARNAIVEIKHHKLHLEYMEHISRIITQNKNIDVIIQETISTMLEIFSADRAMLIKPDSNAEGGFTVDCETASNSPNSVNNFSAPVVDTLEYNILQHANNSEHPIISHYNSSNPAPPSNNTLKQQMLSALHLEHSQNWYLIIQQSTPQANWMPLDEETFYKISLRMTNMLSRYLLTEKLSRSETLLKQAQKIGHLGNWSWDAATKKLSWSDEVYQIYKCQRDSYTPEFNKYFEIDFDEDVNRLNLFKDIQNQVCQSYQIIHRIRIFDNTVRWVHEQCVGVYGKTGKLLEINGIVQDITEAHNKKEQEVHNNKMDAIGQLTSGIAHDFGNFMTVARGNLELLGDILLKQYSVDGDDMELLEDAYSAVNDSVQLTRQLLAFSRKKSIAPVCVNIKRIINEFKKLFKNTLGDTIKMSINIDDDLSDILVDPAQFESTLLNIIINARNAMPDGGEVEINAEIRATELSQEVIHNEDHDLAEKCVCISIKDNGTGMSNDVLKHAIEPFYTTQINKGTGLGLSMVYGFIKQSRGELIIRSQPEKGTTVYMQFPIYQCSTAESFQKETANSLHNVQATILIVEDRESVRKFAARCLTDSGMNILEAEDAAAARELLKSNKVDLLFTDILMPGDMDGYDLANWTHSQHPDLKILLTTAMENENKKSPASKHNFPLLQKPYSKDELIDIISGFLVS